jgi:hypothetical protein
VEEMIMPHQQWVHRCPATDNKTVWTGEEICRSCGEKGKPDGLGLSGIEAMGNFRRLTGLPPIGPHMPILPKFTENCPACNGKSVIHLENQQRWVSCLSCDGTGAIVTVPESKFVHIQKEAWALYDAWRIERVGELRKSEVPENQRRRTFKTQFRRDHYAPKRSKRTLRYFARRNRLMSLMADPDCDKEIVAEWDRLICPQKDKQTLRKWR